jgi:hypothetical protein
MTGIAAATPALGQQGNSFDPTFGSRIEKPDGSVALTIGRRLPTEWDAKFGMDATLAPEPPAALAVTTPNIAPDRRSSGTVWGSMTGPSVAPFLFDKTAVDARLDPAGEKGEVAATLSRTVPLGESLSVTLQDKYSVTQSITTPSQLSGGQVWQADRSVRLKIAPTSTTLSAGIITTSTDNLQHNKFGAEQRVFGPLNVITSVTDPGTAASSKSIAAGFKHTW